MPYPELLYHKAYCKPAGARGVDETTSAEPSPVKAQSGATAQTSGASANPQKKMSDDDFLARYKNFLRSPAGNSAGDKTGIDKSTLPA